MLLFTSGEHGLRVCLSAFGSRGEVETFSDRLLGAMSRVLLGRFWDQAWLRGLSSLGQCWLLFCVGFVLEKLERSDRRCWPIAYRSRSMVRPLALTMVLGPIAFSTVLLKWISFFFTIPRSMSNQIVPEGVA